MAERPIDELDRRILQALQDNARDASATEIADQADVSARTVRNRIDRLEERGIVTGYHADIDYERAGYQLHSLIVATAPIHEREEIARRALDVEGVVAIREVMTGAENVHVEVVGRDGDDLSRIGRELTDIGLEVVDEDIIRNEYTTPLGHFDVE